MTAELGRQLAAALAALVAPDAATIAEVLAAMPERRVIPEATTVERGPLVAPRNAVETVLARQWAEVLGLDAVGVTETFCALGGSSLAATQIVARVRARFKLAIPVRVLFESPTVEAFAHALVTREQKPAQVQRIAQLILQVDGMSADDLRTAAARRSTSSPRVALS